MPVMTRDEPSPPIWHKTGTTSTTPAIVALPIGLRAIKVWVDVSSYVGVGATATAQASAAGADAVQTITTPGSPTGGTFKLEYLGQTTGTIAYNASAATIDTALELLNTIDTGGVVTAGGALPTAVTVTFSAAPVAKTPVQDLHVVEELLTGGTIPHVLVRTTTAGSAPYGYVEAGTQEVFSIDEDRVRFIYLATVASTGNYRISAYR